MFRGYLILGASLVGLVSFCFLMLFGNSLSFFWLFMELGTLSIIPSFFYSCNSSVLGNLFSYIIVSSISSSLILCGFISEGLVSLILLGFLVKFGVFPFCGWVYGVVVNSNWFVVWAISTFLKVPLFLFPTMLSCGGVSLVSVFVCLTFIFVAIVFWLCSFTWFHCWCHMMVSSSAALVAMSLCVSNDLLVSTFVVYFFWSSLVIVFFSVVGFEENMNLLGVGHYFVFCLLLVSLPVSVSLFYKLLMAGAIFSCSYPVIFFWVVYSLSEQFYFLNYLVSYDLPKFTIGFGSFV